MDAFTAYSQDLDDYIRLITGLCIAVNADGDVSDHCVSGIGTVLREYIDKQDVVKNYFFRTKIGTLLYDEGSNLLKSST